jgi:hypothetical protein
MVPFVLSWTDYSGARFEGIVRYEFGYFWVYLAVFASTYSDPFYLPVQDAVSRTTVPSSSSTGASATISSSFVVTFLVVCCISSHMQEHPHDGNSAASIILLFINNYAISDDRLIDFKSSTRGRRTGSRVFHACRPRHAFSV